MAYNKAIITGNIVRDPELRTTQGGLTICSITVAVTNKYTAKDGSKKEDTAYLDVVSFGKQAEIIEKYFSKGKPILVEGRLKQETWEDKNGGGKRSKIVIVMESFEFIGGKQEQGAQQSNTQTNNQGSYPADTGDNQDDDVPF